MEWITILGTFVAEHGWTTVLALFGVLLGGGMLFGFGCSIGRSYALAELNAERHRRLVTEVRCDRLGKDVLELRERLTQSRKENYALGELLFPSPKAEPSVPYAQRGTVVALPTPTKSQPGAA